MNIAHWLERTARITPERPALFLGRELIADYGMFDAKARAVAFALAGLGVRAGDRVALFMKNCPEYLIAEYAVWYLGAVVVPINAKLHAREAAFILENSGSTFVFATPELAATLVDVGIDLPICDAFGPDFAAMCESPAAHAVARRAPQDLAWLFYTSGTTGQPKGVLITHRMLVTMSLCYQADVERVQPQDTALYAAPLSHAAGTYNMLHVQAGARHVFPPSGGFDPAEIFELAAHFGDVHLFAAPTMVQRMTTVAKAAGVAGEGLRTVIYAGGPMYHADIVAAVDHFGPLFVQIYGQGECPMGISVLSRHDVMDRQHARWRERLGSVGRAQSAVEVAIGTRQGEILREGEPGEIMVRGDTVMPGYWQNPEATAKTLVNGWLMTGDMGVMDADGYITLQDRSKDMIITGGSNVYPREVEEVLLTHPHVSEVSVVGRVHAEWGEEVVAFIVGDAPEAELDQLCLDNIARFKRPKAYIRVDQLPKNNYGKVLKTELRARLADT